MTFEIVLWYHRCNIVLQGVVGSKAAAGLVPPANREHRGPCRKTEDTATSDLYSEMNLTEIQKLKEQLMTVCFENIFEKQITYIDQTLTTIRDFVQNLKMFKIVKLLSLLCSLKKTLQNFHGPDHICRYLQVIFDWT